jgi:di/tricarboxylate transporter
MTDLPIPAVASLVALVLAIVVSMTTKRNVGLLAIAMAWVVGVGVAGLKADAIAAGFPSGLFVTLVGVTLLFAIAETNGTLGRLSDVAVRLAHGDARWLPLVFFVIAALISTVGPGAIASVALIAPVAMVVGARAGGSPLVMALMVGNGANAGNMSPISAVGIIANSRMAEGGLVGHEWRVWAANGIAHVLVAAAAYALFGGWKRTVGEDAVGGDLSVEVPHATASRSPLSGAQRLTMIAIGVWIAAVIALRWPPGLSALTVAVVLLVFRAGDEQRALKEVPWSVLLMVCGVSLLVSMLEKTGGMALFTTLLAKLATPGTVNGAIAFVTGTISSYSSTSGVVLPAFLPTVPGLVRELGGGDPLAVALSINVGSALVDVSPLSTLGALCIAAAPPSVDTRQLFRQLLLWGLSMTVVGALLCQLLAGWMARL